MDSVVSNLTVKQLVKARAGLQIQVGERIAETPLPVLPLRTEDVRAPRQRFRCGIVPLSFEHLSLLSPR